MQNPHIPLLPTAGFTASYSRQEAWIRSSPDPSCLSGMLLSCASSANLSVANCKGEGSPCALRIKVCCTTSVCVTLEFHFLRDMLQS